MPMTRSSRATVPLSGGRYTDRMTSGRWWRLAWAIAVFALAGTPAVRAFCAATCAAHAGHAAPAAAGAHASGHEHGHHHPAAGVDGERGADARIRPAALPCDDGAAAAAAGPRGGVVTTPPAAVFAGAAWPRADGRQGPPASPAPPRPPGGAEAPLPLRI